MTYINVTSTFPIQNISKQSLNTKKEENKQYSYNKKSENKEICFDDIFQIELEKLK